MRVSPRAALRHTAYAAQGSLTEWRRSASCTSRFHASDFLRVPLAAHLAGAPDPAVWRHCSGYRPGGGLAGRRVVDAPAHGPQRAVAHELQPAHCAGAGPGHARARARDFPAEPPAHVDPGLRLQPAIAGASGADPAVLSVLFMDRRDRHPGCGAGGHRQSAAGPGCVPAALVWRGRPGPLRGRCARRGAAGQAAALAGQPGAIALHGLCLAGAWSGLGLQGRDCGPCELGLGAGHHPARQPGVALGERAGGHAGQQGWRDQHRRCGGSAPCVLAHPARARRFPRDVVGRCVPAAVPNGGGVGARADRHRPGLAAGHAAAAGDGPAAHQPPAHPAGAVAGADGGAPGRAGVLGGTAIQPAAGAPGPGRPRGASHWAGGRAPRRCEDAGVSAPAFGPGEHGARPAGGACRAAKR